MRFLKILFVLAVLVQAGFSQQGWESKEVANWDKNDVSTVLTASSWSRSFTRGWNIEQILDGEMKATVVLRSALPIRLALLRRAQLDAKYDAMSEKAQKEFDKKNAQLLSCPACATHYIVSVLSKDARLSAGFVNGKKEYITLANDQGTKIELAGFALREFNQETEMIFFFPRPIGEDIFLKPKASKFSFNLDFRVEDLRGFPVRTAEFDISEITRDGTIVF